jgi:hypothetical protein
MHLNRLRRVTFAKHPTRTHTHTHTPPSLQLLSLYHHSPSNAAVLYRLSRAPSRDFPLAIVSLNATKFTLQVRVCDITFKV